MIPTEAQAKALWITYHVPDNKQIHLTLVARVARFLAGKFQVDIKLLTAAALLHDIDKAVPKLPGEKHPDTAVRLLREEHMEEVGDIVKTHPLHAILDSAISPKTWEEKLLFLADKMVKYEIITVDKRFDLWRAENLSQDAKKILEESYPKVKQLEREILTRIKVQPSDVAFLT
jgi:putative nucleotidyltransferase with HDIG domain